MAKSIDKVIRLETPKEKIKEQNLNELLDALSENKDSILKVIGIIKHMDDNRNLDTLSAMVNHQEDILANFSKEANKSRTLRS